MDTDQEDLIERESGEHMPSLTVLFLISCWGFPNGAPDEPKPNSGSTRVNRSSSHMSAFTKGNRNFRILDVMELSIFQEIRQEWIGEHKKVTV